MSKGLAPVRPLMLTAVPAVLGVVGGILAVRFVGDGNGQVLKPPFLGALLPLVLLTRGLALGVDPWLGVRQRSEALEFLGGAGAVLLLLGLGTSAGGAFCAIPALAIWLWASVSWTQYHLPPFRNGVWFACASLVGGWGGLLIAYGQG